MASDRLRFAESVRKSWDAIGTEDRALLREALSRIADDPISGVPLAAPVEGYWSAREGRARVIYRLVPETGAVFVVRLTVVEGDGP